MFNLQTGASSQVGAHDAPVKCVRWTESGGGILITGSWDKTVKVDLITILRCVNASLRKLSALQYWNTRDPNPLGTLQLPERVYAMDVAQLLLVSGET